MDNVCLIQQHTETISVIHQNSVFNGQRTTYIICKYSHWSDEKPEINDIRRASVMLSPAHAVEEIKNLELLLL